MCSADAAKPPYVCMHRPQKARLKVCCFEKRFLCTRKHTSLLVNPPDAPTEFRSQCSWTDATRTSKSHLWILTDLARAKPLIDATISSVHHVHSYATQETFIYNCDPSSIHPVPRDKRSTTSPRQKPSQILKNPDVFGCCTLLRIASSQHRITVLGLWFLKTPEVFGLSAVLKLSFSFFS